MIAQIITYQGATTGLLCAQPNWDTQVKVALEIPTDIAKQPITFTESRRNFAQSARYSMAWMAYLPTAANATELRIFLTRIRGEAVAVPLWTDACELDTVAAIGATTVFTLDAPVRYGTPWIIANDDFSIYEIVSVSALSAVSGHFQLTVSATTKAWNVGDRMWPLMFGRFSDRPRPESISDECFEVELKVQENADFSKRLSTIAAALPTVGSHIPAFSTTPLWTTAPNFVRPLDWTEMPDVTYELIGFLRQEQQRVYDHRNARGMEFEYYQNTRDTIDNIELFFRTQRGPVLRFMVPTWHGDMRMSADTPVGGSAAWIMVEDTEFGDPQREAQPGDPYIALIDPDQSVDPYQLSSAFSDSSSSSSVSQTNLISYWKLDETSGTRADSKGTNTLTDNNTVLFLTGIINNAADFESTNSEYLSLASNSTVQTGDIDFTFTAWVKLESKPAVAGHIISKRGASSPSGIFEYDLRYDAKSDAFMFEVSPNGNYPTGYVISKYLGSPVIGTWYFIAAWHDSVNNILGISLNAGTANTKDYSGGAFVGTAPFQLGAASGAEFFDGLIDEVSFWKRKLSQTEISQLYNNGAGLAYPLGGVTGPGGAYLVATTSVGAHTAATTLLSSLLLARFADPTLEWTYITPYLASTRIKFIELPHEYANPPAALQEPAYLFIFTESNVVTSRYTSYENTIVMPSGTYANTYVPAPFSFENVTTRLKLDQEKLDFKSFPFTGNPLGKLWPFALDGILTLDVIEVSATSPSSTGAIVRFSGDVWSVDSQYKATALAFGNFFERKFPRFLLSVSDNYTQFSTPTNIVASSFQATGTFSTITLNSQTVVISSSGAHAQAADYYSGGWFETGTSGTANYERRSILHSTPGSGALVTLTIDRPIIKAVNGQALTVFPGYDGNIDTCETKFSNRINFGGHAYIPNVNPAVKAMKEQPVPGGKKA